MASSPASVGQATASPPPASNGSSDLLRRSTRAAAAAAANVSRFFSWFSRVGGGQQVVKQNSEKDRGGQQGVERNSEENRAVLDVSFFFAKRFDEIARIEKRKKELLDLNKDIEKEAYCVTTGLITSMQVLFTMVTAVIVTASLKCQQIFFAIAMSIVFVIGSTAPLVIAFLRMKRLNTAKHEVFEKLQKLEKEATAFKEDIKADEKAANDFWGGANSGYDLVRYPVSFDNRLAQLLQNPAGEDFFRYFMCSFVLVITLTLALSILLPIGYIKVDCTGDDPSTPPVQQHPNLSPCAPPFQHHPIPSPGVPPFQHHPNSSPAPAKPHFRHPPSPPRFEHPHGPAAAKHGPGPAPRLLQSPPPATMQKPNERRRLRRLVDLLKDELRQELNARGGFVLKDELLRETHAQSCALCLSITSMAAVILVANLYVAHYIFHL